MGVKSLWTLLTPVGRPVMLETVEGKAMAIDSSIWIYQFQATMRDKEGQALINAHVLGFLRRISKLLFYGIKPVFVFDGGAPVLKRTTLNERKQKKSGAAANHVKVAEKLLAAQMRREALNAAQGPSSARKDSKRNTSALDDDTVYLEDLEGPLMTPVKPKRQRSPLSSSKKANKYRDHDPYRLPELDLEEKITKATRSTVPDPRLATEEELRLFIEEMRPEDFDINSPAFRELPTEIQYEIVGDLRLKSRQTSYARLQKMLQSSRTPLDFSKQQIQNLRQRNALTQQLLTTTDSIGSAHIAIPVRIASERNKQYLLVKNEGESGGWILGIRDAGTREKPITIDHDDEQPESDDSDLDMEEVPVPMSDMPDSDLREYQREMALSAHEGIQVNRKTIVADNHDLLGSEGELLSVAIERSLDDLAPSKRIPTINLNSTIASTPSIEDIYEEITPPTRLETALTFAGTAHGPVRTSPTKPGTTSVFGKQNLLSPRKERSSASSKPVDESDVVVEILSGLSTGSGTVSSLFGSPTLLSTPGKKTSAPSAVPFGDNKTQSTARPSHVSSMPIPEFLQSPSDSDRELEEVLVDVASTAGSFPVDTDKGMTQPHDFDSPPLFFERSPQSFSQDLDDVIDWSRTPSPALDPQPVSAAAQDQEWDAALEMDAQAEEGEFARFISQVKGKNIDDVRKEIDDEINDLNRQRRAAMRDSEDVTQQMITQIMTMLRLFGIPYITAPMEAEAQCAELVSLNLVDGVITDDSDVFLFGAQRVYKNMFNQSKTVECFLLSDLSRELGLDRDTLIRLAYLLGSDYTEGLPGVGPVVAMELLKEFPGREGLHKFKEWWTKVQLGKDRDEDNQSKFRRQLKKKFKKLYLPTDWPNSVVRDAYYHPTVDSAEDPFKWGMPDLDGLRMFFHQELGWRQSKVDDLLLPIIQRMNRRNQAAALNKQGDLNDFFDISSGSGTRAPRQQQAYASKRLQQVISDFRKQQRSGSITPGSRSLSRATSRDSGSENESHHSIDPGPVAKKRKTKNKSSTRVGTSTSRGRGSRIPKAIQKRQIDATEQNMIISDGDGDFVLPQDIAVGGAPDERKLRPRVKPRPTYRADKESQNELVPGGA